MYNQGCGNKVVKVCEGFTTYVQYNLESSVQQLLDSYSHGTLLDFRKSSSLWYTMRIDN